MTLDDWLRAWHVARTTLDRGEHVGGARVAIFGALRGGARDHFAERTARDRGGESDRFGGDLLHERRVDGRGGDCGDARERFRHHETERVEIRATVDTRAEDLL